MARLIRLISLKKINSVVCALSPESLDRFYFTKILYKTMEGTHPLMEGRGFNHVSGKYFLNLTNSTRDAEKAS